MDIFNRKHILITGGLGFIGSTLARRLVELGANVTLVDSLIPEYGGNLFNIAGIEDRVRVNISDVRDEHSMNYLVQGQDYLFNLAGQTSHLDSMRGSVHRPGDQLPGAALHPGSLPAIQPGHQDRVCQHAPDSTANPTTCRWTRNTCCDPWT